MNNNRIIDTTFGLNHQALAILKFMENYEPSFAEFTDKYHLYDVDFETKPWYNGRESGFVIAMRASYKKVLHIAVFEHRNSDNICCLKWETDNFKWNGYTDNDFKLAYSTDSKWALSATFKNGEIRKTVLWIFKTLEQYYKEHHQFNVTTEAKMDKEDFEYLKKEVIQSILPAIDEDSKPVIRLKYDWYSDRIVKNTVAGILVNKSFDFGDCGTHKQTVDAVIEYLLYPYKYEQNIKEMIQEYLEETK